MIICPICQFQNRPNTSFCEECGHNFSATATPENQAQLDHPNIVSVYDAGAEDGLPYIVMQYVVGETFDEAPPDTLEEIVELTIQLCRALEHAHEKGIVHRDINPSNVIQTKDGAVRLMDLASLACQSPT